MTDAPARCEPPAELRGKNEWHWLAHDEDIRPAQWAGNYGVWWNDLDLRGHTATEAYAKSYRYVAPYPSPDELAALVRAARHVIASVANMDMLPCELPVVDCNTFDPAWLAAALAPFAHIGGTE